MAAAPSPRRPLRADAAPAAEALATQDLYERYARQIFGYCFNQLGSREEAEDAVQSTFLNAFRGLRRGIVPEAESAWLFKIAQNVCLSRRRSSWRRGRVESPADFELVEELAPAPSRRADELIGLQDVLEQMPESQRRAILLREWQGLSYREIAEELELSQAAVETLIFRARRSLAQGLETPPEPARARVRRGADLGNVLAGLKTLLLRRRCRRDEGGRDRRDRQREHRRRRLARRAAREPPAPAARRTLRLPRPRRRRRPPRRHRPRSRPAPPAPSARQPLRTGGGRMPSARSPWVRMAPPARFGEPVTDAQAAAVRSGRSRSRSREPAQDPR